MSNNASHLSKEARADMVRQYERETRWPIRHSNTILNVCPQGERMIVERLGSLHRIHDSGLFSAIPGVDKISYRVDMRERTVRYPPQLAITKDNVSVELSAVVFLQFVDAEKACYGCENPLVAVMELAKSAMRAVVGELELDQLFHSRHLINDQVREVVRTPAQNWGIVVNRHEVLDVRTDVRIAEAMDRQAAAERIRRERVLQAEGEKEQLRLKSEGARIRLENESEGNRIRVENEAKADAESTRLRAEAESNALTTIARAFEQKNGREAAQLKVARDYIAMYARMGAHSNTIMVGDRAADVNALMAQAGLALGAVGGGGASK